MTASASSVRLDYFYGNEVKTGTFFRVPKVFETNEVYRAVSLEVKYLYSLMLDRVSISTRNGWLDEGRVFIYFTLEEVRKCIRAGKNKAVKALHDMETLGLIQRKKQGQGKPTRIFLKNIIEEKAEPSNHDKTENTASAETKEVVDEIPAQISETAENGNGQGESAVMPSAAVNEEPVAAQDEKWDTPAPVSDSVSNEEATARDCKIQTPADCTGNVPAFGDKCAQNRPNEGGQTACSGTSRGLKTGSQDFPNQDTNYNKRNKNKKNNTDSKNINLSPPTPSPRRITLPPVTREEIEEERRECREFVKESIGYDLLLHEYPGSVRTIDGYVELITEALCNEGPYIRIGQQEYTVYEVRERFYQLSHEHICYVLDCMKNTSTKIFNMRAYTLTALFNAPLTVDQYYENLVNQNFAEESDSYGQGYGYGGESCYQYHYRRKAG